VVGVILVVLGWQLKAALQKVGELEAKLEQQARETEECVTANGTNQTTITDLESQIATMVEERRADAERREQVLTERERELEEARARADRLERERENEIASNDDCAALMQLDLDSFCPATAHQLRQRTIGASGDGDANH
jgi:chromosome segregation ATPase